MKIDQKLEDINGKTIDGHVDLDTYKGNKNVVLYFYPKDSTPGCSREAMDFNSKLKEFESLNTEIIGISIDSIESHKKFKEKYGLKFSLISDSDKKLVSLFDVMKLDSKRGSAKRTTFLIDKNLTIRYIWENVKVANHALEVLNKIKELNL